MIALDDDARWEIALAKDRRFDGAFVKSHGVSATCCCGQALDQTICKVGFAFAVLPHCTGYCCYTVNFEVAYCHQGLKHLH